MFDEDFVPLTPVNFFQVQANCLKLVKGSFPVLNAQNFRKYLLPDLASLCSETAFAKIAMGWSEEGLEFFVRVDQSFHVAYYPQVDRGDSVEVFIDTRDVKTSGFNTRFCHHFFFLPEGVEGRIAGEMTRFRTEDTHELCDPNELQVKYFKISHGYCLNIFIPSHCLHGYDPEQFDRLGFTYRINRAHGFPQHYSVVTEDYQIEQQPSLWGSLKLFNENGTMGKT